MSNLVIFIRLCLFVEIDLLELSNHAILPDKQLDGPIQLELFENQIRIETENYLFNNLIT
jgi:hypothetical protein